MKLIDKNTVHSKLCLLYTSYLDSGENEKIIKAVSLLKNAANQGNDMAQYTLGKLYQQGKEVVQNTIEAIRYLLFSAEQGNEYAACLLGRTLIEEEEHRDIEEGIHWLTFASNKNNSYAQYQLGRLLSLIHI